MLLIRNKSLTASQITGRWSKYLLFILLVPPSTINHIYWNLIFLWSPWGIWFKYWRNFKCMKVYCLYSTTSTSRTACKNRNLLLYYCNYNYYVWLQFSKPHFSQYNFCLRWDLMVFCKLHHRLGNVINTLTWPSPRNSIFSYRRNRSSMVKLISLKIKKR